MTLLIKGADVRTELPLGAASPSRHTDEMVPGVIGILLGLVLLARARWISEEVSRSSVRRVPVLRLLLSLWSSVAFIAVIGCAFVAIGVVGLVVDL